MTKPSMTWVSTWGLTMACGGLVVSPLWGALAVTALGDSLSVPEVMAAGGTGAGGGGAGAGGGRRREGGGGAGGGGAGLLGFLSETSSSAGRVWWWWSGEREIAHSQYEWRKYNNN